MSILLGTGMTTIIRFRGEMAFAIEKMVLKLVASQLKDDNSNMEKTIEKV